MPQKEGNAGANVGHLTVGSPLMVKFSPAFLEVLRSTLEQVEQTPGLDPNDPKFIEFKTAILRAIAEMELRKTDAA